MSSTALLTPVSPAIGSPVLRAIVCDGLAPDRALDGLGPRLAAVRLVFPAAEAARCCAGHQPAFIAVDPDDPTLPDHERRELGTLGPGRAVPGRGLEALAGGAVALPGRSLTIGSARDLGAGVERAVILTLADAALGVVQAGAGDAFTPQTVAVVHGAAAAPTPWRAAGAAVERVLLSAGLTAVATRKAAA